MRGAFVLIVAVLAAVLPAPAAAAQPGCEEGREARHLMVAAAHPEAAAAGCEVLRRGGNASTPPWPCWPWSSRRRPASAAAR